MGSIEEGPGDFVSAIGMTVMICLVVATIIMIIASCFPKKVDTPGTFEYYLKEHKCESFSSIPTGNKIYCGKACFRDEIKYDYICEGDKHITKIE